MSAVRVGEASVRSHTSSDTRGHTQGRDPTCAWSVDEPLVISQPSENTRRHTQMRSLIFVGSGAKAFAISQPSAYTTGHTRGRSLPCVVRLEPEITPPCSPEDTLQGEVFCFQGVWARLQL